MKPSVLPIVAPAGLDLAVGFSPIASTLPLSGSEKRTIAGTGGWASARPASRVHTRALAPWSPALDTARQPAGGLRLGVPPHPGGSDDRRSPGWIRSAAQRRPLDDLVRRAYPELRAVAARALRDERAATLKPTALVHEIYLRLAQLARIEWQGTPHLLAMATRVAREALVDEARRRGRSKRDGGVRVTVSLERIEAAAVDRDVLLVDDLLRTLEDIDETAARVVELRVFGGLSLEECAADLEASPSTVSRKWRAGRTWLVRELAA